MLQVLQSLPRAQVVFQSGDVIRVVVGSAIFRFKDDLEFRFDPGASVVHVRSASRTGHWDLGMNRRRVESIRTAFAESFARQP